MKEFENATGPVDTTARAILEKEIKFSYRQAIEELLFGAIICRPGIIYAFIKLSQDNNKPAHAHYIAVKRVFKYLRDTLDEGFQYWYTSIHDSLPDLPIPIIARDNHDIKIPNSTATQPVGFVDSDWSGGSKQCRSISGMSLCFAGVPVVYRSRFQSTVSQSSTKADLIAAAEVGKLALYLRSILKDI